jgi:FtsP/CotA-like multicopper oxidase with cupredoxin domain
VSATRIAANDNRQSGGRLKNDTFRIRLEARTGQWLPEGDAGKSLDVAAWAEVGKPMQNPGPLIRVPEGTEVRASLRNTLAKPLTVYGFGTTRGVTDSVTLEPGATREVSFTATTAGTYYYAGKTVAGPVAKDGAALPQNQAVMRPATMIFDPGEIYDFEYTPTAPGELKLTYGTPPFLKIPGSKLTSVRVRIRGETSLR